MLYSKLVIDTSNAYMRAYAVGGSMTNRMSDGSTMVTGGIYTFLRMIRSLENRFLMEGGEVWFVFDNSHSGIDRRKELDPTYKSNRTKKDESFYRSIDILQTILLNYKDSWKCVKKAGYEADDLVYPIVQQFQNEAILLISNDLDWFRAISDRVHVAKYEKSEATQKTDYVIYDPERFEKKMGFKPSVSAMVLYKSFRGDMSDNIPAGVSGIRSDALVSIISSCRTVKDVLLSLSDLKISDTFKKKIEENKSRLFLNEKLVSYQNLSFEELQDDIYDCTFHAKTLHSLYKSLGFQIDKIDPRVQRVFIKETAPETGKNFFKVEKIHRA